MSNNTINPLSALAASSATGSNNANNTSSSWFEAMAEAWGRRSIVKPVELNHWERVLARGLICLHRLLSSPLNR